jgi:hypothetical protein
MTRRRPGRPKSLESVIRKWERLTCLAELGAEADAVRGERLFSRPRGQCLLLPDAPKFRREIPEED